MGRFLLWVIIRKHSAISIQLSAFSIQHSAISIQHSAISYQLMRNGLLLRLSILMLLYQY
ncbi:MULTISPECIES: hypothetical protein [unclassified Moorena]|uniref:hypothetical protein n=1 Tax=unclassified Moorena TaxID=2683338 RepID=UPI0013FF40CD|nr:MULTISPECIES: hypothetical protein [unclassified Moorena]NEO13821.1 hypothetical protein [Moorena sp. SIO3E8]NEQ00713.1 hypothetical protein [Moorena sp. SIO3F7]